MFSTFRQFIRVCYLRMVRLWLGQEAEKRFLQTEFDDSRWDEHLPRRRN